jgi:hypothetical protein
MRDGADHSGVPYVWPRTLRLPRRPPKLVYLDLNHWVSLAKAWAGRDDGQQWAQSLTACLDAAQQGRAVFPISDTIYHEVSKIRQHRQRRDLREVIESVSRYMVVTSRSVVSSHEIEALLNQRVGPNPHPVNAMDYLDWGVARAFGMAGGFTVTSQDGEDVKAEVRSSYPEGPHAFDRFLAQAEWDLNRMIIEGPTAEEEPELRELGWDPTAGFEIPERRAAQEIEQVARFDHDPRWRRGRIRDVVAAREVVSEINEALFRGVSERGTNLEDVFVQRDEARRAFDSMPSFDVAVSLKTEYHRDSTHRWTSNDIHDIDALGSTLPYCDIVVTDKAAASHAQRAGLPERLNTLVLSRIVDLPQHL